MNYFNQFMLLKFSLNMKNSSIFFVSTPLHVLNSLIIALGEYESNDCILIFIDQPKDRENHYYNILKNWEKSPFKKILYFQSSGNLNKYQHRKNIFKDIYLELNKINFSKIYTSNDRRIEFIYAYKLLKKLNKNIKCIYIDDGIMSYVIHKYSWESPLEILVKKLYYGFWYNRTRIVGSSKFINSSIVAFPKFVHHYLKKSNPILLKSEYFKKNIYLDFLKKILYSFKQNSNIHNLKYILILPHQIELKKYWNFYNKLKDDLIDNNESTHKIGIKYHPFQNGDPLNFKNDNNFTIINSDIAFECIVPFLKKETTIIGDVSTAMIYAKLIKKKLNVVLIRNKNDIRLNKLRPLLNEIGVIEFDSIKNYLNK